ncbi:YfhE family protein [Anaerobacillus alkalidiazotrophicus]|nr:YfhE family protein [Anaerobacillus alkalidiazotrophicus]
MESKKQRAREERKTMSKAQEFHYLSDFKAADRAMDRARNNKA